MSDQIIDEYTIEILLEYKNQVKTFTSKHELFDIFKIVESEYAYRNNIPNIKMDCREGLESVTKA